MVPELMGFKADGGRIMMPVNQIGCGTGPGRRHTEESQRVVFSKNQNNPPFFFFFFLSQMKLYNQAKQIKAKGRSSVVEVRDGSLQRTFKNIISYSMNTCTLKN